MGFHLSRSQPFSLSKFSTLICICGFLVSLTVSAKTIQATVAESAEISAYFKAQASGFPEQLLKAGISQVGRLNLRQFRQDIGGIRWEVIQGVLAMGSGGRRASAVYTVEDRTVRMNQIYWQQTPEEFRPLMALHESFGALGYDDENYNLSLGLWMLSRDRKNLPAVSDFQKLPRRNKTPVYSTTGGTGTGVGGGGDHYEVQLKIRLLEAVAERPDRLSLQREIQNMNAVVVYPDPDHPSMAPTRVKFVRSRVRVEFSCFIFYMPAEMQRTAVENILRKIEALRGR